MANIRSSYQEIEIPFAKMSWNSDVPSSQLSANEYNIGQNIETDVRGIKSVLGIEPILQRLPTISATEGLPVYITGGYRQDNNWYYIVGARYGNVGRWFQIDATTVTNITPGFSLSATASIPGWTTTPNITESWNGTALVINDNINPPYYLQGNNTEFKYYSNVADYQIYSDNVTTGITYTATTVTVILSTFATNTPYVVGDIIQIVDAYSDNGGNPLEFNGSYTITNVPDSFTIQFTNPGFSGTYVKNTGLVRPKYQWNYNPEWYSVSAGFCRVFNAPNVGSVLIAGDLTVQVGKDVYCDTNSNTTVQLYGTSKVKDYIGYTITGPGILPGTTITAATVGSPNVLTISQAASATASGVILTIKKSTLDRFPNTVRWSQNFGLNEVPPTWAPTINNVANELEVPLRGPVLDGFPSNGQFFVCSYWDTVVFSPIAYQTTQVPVFGVRLFNNGRGLLSSNCWVNADDKVYGIDARDWWVFDGNNFVGLANQRVKNYIFENIKPGQTYTNLVFMENNTSKNQVELYYPYDDASTTYCNEMISYRYDIDTFNPPWRWTTTDGNIANVTPIVSATEGPVFRVNQGNIFDPSTRTVTLVTPVASANVNYKPIAQKDQGFAFVNQSNSSIKYNITSTFRRDNIQLLKDYSGQLLVHRVLPEMNNINEFGREVYYANTPAIQANVANVLINVGGSDSTGEIPTMTGNITLRINTVDPWVQIDQNAYRLNTVEFNHVSTNTAVILNSLTWQITQTQDAR